MARSNRAVVSPGKKIIHLESIAAIASSLQVGGHHVVGHNQSMPVEGDSQLMPAPVPAEAAAMVDERGRVLKQNIERLMEILSRKAADKKNLDENNFETEGEKVEAERRILYSDSTERQLRTQLELQQLKHANRLPHEDFQEANGRVATLIVPVRDTKTQDTFNQAMTLDRTDFENFKEFAMNISDDHLRKTLPPSQAESLINLKLTQPKDYMTTILVQLSNRVERSTNACSSKPMSITRFTCQMERSIAASFPATCGILWS